jgi:hypothetical protein
MPGKMEPLRFPMRFPMRLSRWPFGGSGSVDTPPPTWPARRFAARRRFRVWERVGLGGDRRSEARDERSLLDAAEGAVTRDKGGVVALSQGLSCDEAARRHPRPGPAPAPAPAPAPKRRACRLPPTPTPCRRLPRAQRGLARTSESAVGSGKGATDLGTNPAVSERDGFDWVQGVAVAKQWHAPIAVPRIKRFHRARFPSLVDPSWASRGSPGPAVLGRPGSSARGAKKLCAFLLSNASPRF